MRTPLNSSARKTQPPASVIGANGGSQGGCFSLNRTSIRALSALLALLLCFFAVAVYSPLHVHKNRQCSLNNLEHQIADSITPVLDLPQPLDEAVAVLADESPVTPAAPALEHASRGPPSVSFS